MASRSSGGSSAVPAFIVLMVFASFFVAMGVGVAVGSRHKGEVGIYVGGVLAIIGVGVMALAVWVLRSDRQQRSLQQANPDKPWLWNSDWASGNVPDHAVRGAFALWMITAVLNAIALPAALIAVRQYRRDGDLKALFVLLFVGAGLYFFGQAILATLRAKRFGTSIFQLQTLPGVIGGTLAGNIRVPRLLQSDQKIRLHLTCTHTSRSSGQKSSSKTLIWEDEQEVDHITKSRDESDIPVRFAIPRGEFPSSLSQDRTQVVWQLEASGKMQGVDYLSRFKVPVFKLPSSLVEPSIDAGPTPWLIVPEPTRAEGPAEEPAKHRGISLSRLANGGCRIDFAAARNLGMIVFLALMGIPVTAGAILLPLPWFPIAIIWIIALSLDISLLHALFSSATITAGTAGLNIDRGLPFLRSRRDLKAESINKITMSMGTTLGDTAYYALQAVTEGKSFTIVRGIQGKPTAKWLAAELERSLGLSDQRVSLADQSAT